MTSEITTLNLAQRTAITYGQGPLLIIAGAGTGKTTVITERIAHLILEKKIRPENILALTFTEKAAAEMEQRVDVVLPYGYATLWIETFHGFCDRILRSEAQHIGLDPAYKLMTEAESIYFLRKHMFDLHLSYFRPLGNPNKFLQGLLQHFSRLQDEDITPNQYVDWVKTQNSKLKTQSEESEEMYEELANAYKTYQELKAKEGVMDFSDLISNTLLLFRKRKQVLARYQQQFQYILVDEFQDTNFSQNEIALLLTGKEGNITVVGDDDQSIYRFRGSSVSNMLQFREHFPKAKIVTLTQNYRSKQTILDSAYSLIQHNNPDRLEVKEHIEKRLTSTRKGKDIPVEFFCAESVEKEATYVLESINKLVASGKYTYKDIAILVRANDHAQVFMRVFDRVKLPYQFLGPARLFHQEEIKDLIAYLKILYDTTDVTSFYRILNLPYWKLQPTTIILILSHMKKNHLTIPEALEDNEEVTLIEEEKEKLRSLRDIIINHLSIISKESAGKILFSFLQLSGIADTMLHPQSVAQENQAENITKFFERIQAYEGTVDNATVTEIVDWIDLLTQVGESPMASQLDWTENNAVNLLTVHSSKGLEFPVVFLVNMVRDRFPSRERKEQIPIPDALIKEHLPVGDFHLQEERRLAYVGMTRAKDVLFLTAAKFYGESKREKRISPFVYETLGEEQVEKLLKTQSLKKSQLSLLDIFGTVNKPPQEENHKEKRLISFLSYSQIQSFDICPLHYKLQYILKVPTPLSPNQSFGLSIHAALREYYQLQINKQPQESIDALLKKHWIRQGYESRKHQEMAFDKAKDMLEKFVEKDKNHGIIKAVELPFEFFLHDHVNKRTLKIGGRIDRIDQAENGNITIIDYKTGTTLPTPKELDKDMQLTMYGLAATQIQDDFIPKKPEEITLSFYYLDSNTIVSSTRTPEDFEKAKQFLFEKAKEIEESDFACSRSIFCENCEYKMLCNVRG